MSTDLLQFINKFSCTIFKEHFLHNLLVFLWIIYSTECCCFSLVVPILSRFPCRQCKPFWSTQAKVTLICTPADTRLRRGSRSRFESSAGRLSLTGHVNPQRGRQEVELTLSLHWGSGALFFYRQEWGMSSQKWERSPRAPPLGCWAWHILLRSWWMGTGCWWRTEPLSCTHKPWLAPCLEGWIVLCYFWYWCHFFGRWRYLPGTLKDTKSIAQC